MTNAISCDKIIMRGGIIDINHRKESHMEILIILFVVMVSIVVLGIHYDDIDYDEF